MQSSNNCEQISFSIYCFSYRTEAFVIAFLQSVVVYFVTPLIGSRGTDGGGRKKQKLMENYNNNRGDTEEG